MVNFQHGHLDRPLVMGSIFQESNWNGFSYGNFKFGIYYSHQQQFGSIDRKVIYYWQWQILNKKIQ